MKRFFILLLSGLIAPLMSVMSQTLSVSLSDEVVCVGSDVTVTANYGNATSLLWEYSTDGFNYTSFGSQLTTTQTMTISKFSAYYFRVSTLSGGVRLYSNIAALVSVEPYKPEWGSAPNYVRDGEIFNVCEGEEFSFTFNIDSDLQEFMDRYTSTWLVDDVAKSNEWSFVVPSVDDHVVVTHHVDDKYCGSNDFHFVLDPIYRPKVELEASATIVCEGSDLELKVKSQNADEVYLVTRSDASYNKKSETKLSSDTKVLTPTESASYQLVVKESGGCPGTESEEIHVSVEKRLKDRWEYNGSLVSNGDHLDFCGPMESLPFDFFSGKYSFQDSLEIVNTQHSQWLVDDVKVSDEFNYVISPLKDSCKVSHLISAQVCPPSRFDFYLDVEPTPGITLSAEKNVICEGEMVTLLISSQHAKSLEVYNKTEGTMKSFNTPVTEYSEQISATSAYYVRAKGTNCQSQSEMVTVQVRPAIQKPAELADGSICEGGSVSVYVEQQSDLQYKWEKNGKLFSENPSLEDIPDEDTEYKLTISDGYCEPVESSFKITVMEMPEVKVADLMICEGSSGQLKATAKDGISLQWFADEDLTQSISTGNTLSVSPEVDTRYYLRAVNGGLCWRAVSADVRVGETPRVMKHIQLGDDIYELVAEGGTGVLSYDFGDGVKTTDPKLSNAIPNTTYTVTVSDELGCESSYQFETAVYEIHIPDYFVANRETWMVENLDKFNHVNVKIYDRVGRLLLDKDEFQDGWDGIYNGNPMPSTDYWYLITVFDWDKQFVGHFTLMRE